MAIAKNSHFWTARLGGNDPASPVGNNNTAWTLHSGTSSNGSVSGNAWLIDGEGTAGQIWKQTVANDENDLTIIAGISYDATNPPDASEDILTLDNGSHVANVRVNPSTNTLTLVGTAPSGSKTTGDLDLKMQEFNAVPCLLRLTLNSSGIARLYVREIVEDDDANIHYLEVNCPASLIQGAFFGNQSGKINWFSVYYTPHGAYSPDEMDMSDFTTNSLIRTGINIVNILKKSRRFFIKTHVGEGGIVYGYDLSSNAMTNRIHPPSIHVITQKIESPEFLTLSGTRTDQDYNVIVYVTTKGTDYKNAYRLGLSIMGEIFDELYTKTGLEDGVDSLIAHTTTLDHKIDDDEVVCVHTLTLTYMKKIRMFLREV